MFFEELNDDEWARISALAADEPVHPHRRGRPRAETRVVANAVLWILTTGERWSKLPARYPSGPTCRRRFDEWLADGTLFDIVKALSECGRVFAYVPQPQAAVAPAPKPEPAPESPRLRGVFWTNPESWENAGGCTQRAGDLPVASSRPLQAAGDALRAMHERAQLEGPTFNTATVQTRADEYCGYTVHAIAQPVARQAAPAYRASAEIILDGKRIERSGLIGPRFADYESAQRHALEWARDWVDRQSYAAVAAQAAETDAGEVVTGVMVAPCAAAALQPDEQEPAQDCAPKAGEAEKARDTIARPMPAPLAAIASSAVRSKLESRVGRHEPEWLHYSDTHGDATLPALIYHS